MEMRLVRIADGHYPMIGRFAQIAEDLLIGTRRLMMELPIDFWIGTIGLLIAFYIIERGFK